MKEKQQREDNSAVRGRGPACGCAVGKVGPGGKAVAVEPALKQRTLARLRRIEGQVRGLQRMVAEDRYCADILAQLASVQEALRSVGRELMRNHLRHCATAAIRASDERAEAMYEELLHLMQLQCRR